MSECLPDIPAGSTIRQSADGSWQYQRRNVGPWLPMPAPQGAAPWADGPAVQSREPASVAANPTPLSPAAQAAWDAWNDAYEAQGPLESMDQPLGAALRAAADQVDAVNVPDHIRGDAYWPYRNGRAAAKAHLIAIADELEGFNG